jgi:hypothetical protein
LCNLREWLFFNQKKARTSASGFAFFAVPELPVFVPNHQKEKAKQVTKWVTETLSKAEGGKDFPSPSLRSTRTGLFYCWLIQEIN